MQGESKRPRDTSPFPADALPCVWMTAGLIAYKLCDREYDCERCPLDQALRGGTARQRPERVLGDHPTWDFPEDRFYHPLHGWVHGIDGSSRVRFGLDAFAARLLDHATTVVFPPANANLQRGRTACWIQDEAELIPICAPVSGTVVETNQRVGKDPTLVAMSPYDDGWLLEIQCREPLDQQDGLLGPRAARERTASQLRQLHRRACAGLASDAKVGITMADGGVRLADLRRVVGAGKYHRLILAFLR